MPKLLDPRCSALTVDPELIRTNDQEEVRNVKTDPAKPSRKRVLTGILIVGLSFASQACQTTSTAPAGEEGVALEDPKTPPAELRGLPSVGELPPVVPEARGRLSVADVTGPRKPRIAWSVVLPFSPPSVLQTISVDGTVYVASDNGVGAARDGKLLWAYSARDASPFVTIADDGRIWFPAPGASGYFCLNENGQGGMVPRSFRPPPDAQERKLIGCSGNGRWLRGVGRGDIALEYECTRPQAKLAPDGIAYVGTAAPDIRAVTADGAVAWKIATPCAVETLLAGSGGRVLFSCQDRSLHYIEHGAIQWSKPGDGKIQEGSIIMTSTSFVAVMDRNGTSYFADAPDQGVVTHIHALTSKGETAWTIKIADFIATSMQFDGQGRLLLTGDRMNRDRLVCISD